MENNDINTESRREFEDWAKKQDVSMFTFKTRKGKYYDTITQVAWEAWQAARERQWLPIESAPKNGRVILTWDGVNMSLCNWANCSEVWEQEERMGWSSGYDCSTMSHDEEYPTHWIPLPNPPTSEKI
jgi:hypothetical protein